MKIAFVTVILAFALTAGHAQDREGAAKESADDYKVSECLSDPSCAAAVRNSREASAQAQATWENKSFDQKLEPYIWLALAAGGLWLYLRKSKK